MRDREEAALLWVHMKLSRKPTRFSFSMMNDTMPVQDAVFVTRGCSCYRRPGAPYGGFASMPSRRRALLPIAPVIASGIHVAIPCSDKSSNAAFVRPASTVHLDVGVLALVGTLDPEHVVTPDQNLAEVARELGVDELLGVAELDVHVAVDADQSALVLGLAPARPAGLALVPLSVVVAIGCLPRAPARAGRNG